MTKDDMKSRLMRCLLLLQQFDFEIKDKMWTENMVADHLSRIVKAEEDRRIIESFPNEHLFVAQCKVSWYAHIVN